MIPFQRIKSLTLLLLIFLFNSCAKTDKSNSLSGIWQVTKVSMGENSMTPIARWIHFKTDSTQVSGNGWLQHSYGAYNYINDSLKIIDFNGIKDNFNPFYVTLTKDSMLWKRVENGEEVLVTLKRANKIPTSDGNKLIGLWKHKEKKSMLHLRWDNTYVKIDSTNDRKFGIYKIHGHKLEIQMVPYGEKVNFSFWRFDVTNNTLKLFSINNQETLEYVRTNQYFNE